MAETVTFALAQTTVTEDRNANRSKGLQTVAAAAEAGANFVAFPEMAFDPFFPQYPGKEEYFDWAETADGETTAMFAEVAAEHGISVITNIFLKQARGQHFDASMMIGADGQLHGYSHMLHICETPGFHEKYYYWPGTTDFPVFDTGHCTIAPCICYDRHFPEVMRAFTLRGAEIIVVQTATSREEAGTILEAEMQAAALANGVYVALVNRAGKDGGIDFAGRSFVVSPHGEIINQSTSDSDDLLVTSVDLEEIQRARANWPFLRDRKPEIYDVLLEDMSR